MEVGAVVASVHAAASDRCGIPLQRQSLVIAGDELFPGELHRTSPAASELLLSNIPKSGDNLLRVGSKLQEVSKPRRHSDSRPSIQQAAKMAS